MSAKFATFDQLNLSGPKDRSDGTPVRLFGIFPEVVCMSCRARLDFMEGLGGFDVRRHPDGPCAYAGFKFRFHYPTIEGEMLGK